MIAVKTTISSTLHPLDKSLIGEATPWIIGPNALAPASLWTNLYPIFPADRLGNINTFAFPDTSDNGALISPTDFTRAASACNSSSNLNPTFLSLKILPASLTKSTHSCWADPLVENVRRATLGLIPAITLADSAASQAISASCSEVGLGITEQSPNTKTPPYKSLNWEF